MEFSNRFQLILILFLVSAVRLIENTSNDSKPFPPLCYENTERLVRTPYGFRCVVTKRSNEKRSTLEAELSSQETERNETKPDININNKFNEEVSMKEEDLNSIIPVVEPMTLSSKYRKIVIKNNRGPWKIANMIFKRSPQTVTAYEGTGEELFAEITSAKRDGLLVSKHLVNDSNIDSLSPKSDMYGIKGTETVIPLTPETSIEEKFIRNLPKINLSAKTVDKKNLRNFKFHSDIDVIDLMEEDSILRSHSFANNKTFVVNVLAADRRRTRSPSLSDKNLSDDSADQLKNDDKSEQTFTPIRIFVFLNRNKGNKDKDQRSESSNNRFNIAHKPQRKASYELKGNSSISAFRTSTSTITTTTTEIPKTTTTLIPIKRILKKLDLNEFEERMSADLLNIDDAADREEEERYVEPTEPTIGQAFFMTSVPISRNWNFVCGKRRGFFADIDNDCRTYYQCSVRGRQRWECPPGTRFNQLSSTCDWIENVDCLSFKDIINDKKDVQQNNDIITATSPLPPTSSTASTTTTTISYEPDYEDAFEE